MSYDDHDLCGSFCECGPEVTPMTATELAEYRAETARLQAANVARVQQDAVNLRAYDKATRDALQALRDTDHAAAIVIDREAYPLLRGMGAPDRMRLQVEDDHGTAIVEYRRVLAGRYLDRACEQCGPDADHTNRGHDDTFDLERANAHAEDN